ncbi:MAG: hypothetical protein JWO07_792 [Candidatus Saccharibacteria bacterium]|nr:hypothetical protein [Candidatus Saccharibacteria bacterium]
MIALLIIPLVLHTFGMFFSFIEVTLQLNVRAGKEKARSNNGVNELFTPTLEALPANRRYAFSVLVVVAWELWVLYRFAQGTRAFGRWMLRSLSGNAQAICDLRTE